MRSDLKKNPVKYQSALIKVGKEEVLIDISKAKDYDGKFYCPYCDREDGEMVARCGDFNQWHFAHEKSECDYDNYLHTVAEFKIQKWIRESKEIILSLPYYKACSESVKCGFYTRVSCAVEERKEYNLKEWYKECIREKEIKIGDKTFKPDLLWKRKDKEIEPIFIEICVTHPCEEDKIKSGARIIEFVIETEEDIDKITSSTRIREGERVRLYGFKPQKDEIGEELQRLVKLHKFILFSSYKTFVDIHSLCRHEPTLPDECKSYRLRRGIFEITTHGIFDEQIYNEGGLETIGLAVASRYIKTLRKCCLCKNQTLNENTIVCKLRLERGDRFLTCKDAAQCPEFQLGEEIINRRIEIFNKYRNNNYVDIWLDKKKNTLK